MYVGELRAIYIVERVDYTDYTRDDHNKALAYRILASASLESHVEDICKAAASKALDQMRKGKSSRMAKALVVWYSLAVGGRSIPLAPGEYAEYYPDLPKIQKKYERLVDRSHGIDDKDLRTLVIPLGMKMSDLDPQLLDQLKVIADARNPASHRRINQAKQMREPKVECDVIEQLIPFLETLEQTLEHLAIAE